jgi:pyruvate dehydrogenase E1 component beta subunit
MRELSMMEAIREAIVQEMRGDPRIILMGEDVGKFGGAFHVTHGLLEEFGPHRIWDTPISEAGFMGLGVGAALTGLRPIVELQYADFIFCAMDQVVNEAAKLRLMSGGQASVPLVIRAPQGATGRGAQHSQSVEAWFMHTPGMKVVVPSNPYDAKGLLVSAIRDDNPVLFLEHKMLYFTRGDMPDAEEAYTVPIGKADVKREGTDLTLATFSYNVLQALEAADELKAEHGIDIEVVDLRSITPLDMETVLTSVAKTGRLLAVHESQSNAGIGAEIVARAYEEAPYLLKAPARRLGMAPASIPVSKPLEEELLPWKKNIKAAVLEMLR